MQLPHVAFPRLFPKKFFMLHYVSDLAGDAATKVWEEVPAPTPGFGSPTG